MKYFTIAEMSNSGKARTLKIDNTPSATEQQRIELLINKVLDPIREAWGAPITVDSGFRCPALNKAVKGADNSQHLFGEAADIHAAKISDNKKLWDIIIQLRAEKKIIFDQLIWEYGTDAYPDWIHISYTERKQNRLQKLRIKTVNGKKVTLLL